MPAQAGSARVVASPGARPWRGLAPEERDEQRRQRLLQAALELFGTVGFRGTTVQALCAEANVATRSFYELFGSSEALLRAVYDQVNAEISASIEAIDLSSSADAATIVRAGVRAALGPVLEDERKARVIEIEAVGVSESLEARRHEVMRRLAAQVEAILERLAQAGLAQPVGGGLMGVVLIGGITEALVDHLQTPVAERRTSQELMDELARILLVVAGVR